MCTSRAHIFTNKIVSMTLFYWRITATGRRRVQRIDRVADRFSATFAFTRAIFWFVRISAALANYNRFYLLYRTPYLYVFIILLFALLCIPVENSLWKFSKYIWNPSRYIHRVLTYNIIIVYLYTCTHYNKHRHYYYFLESTNDGVPAVKIVFATAATQCLLDL